MNPVTGNLSCGGCLLAPFVAVAHLFMTPPKAGESYSGGERGVEVLDRPCFDGKVWGEWYTKGGGIIWPGQNGWKKR